MDGVFGGRFSRARSAAFSASKAVTRATKASIRAKSAVINASFSDDESAESSAAGVMERLNRNSIPGATKIYSWDYRRPLRPKTIETFRGREQLPGLSPEARAEKLGYSPVPIAAVKGRP